MRQLVETASQARSAMGYPVKECLLALEHLPEMACGEPCPTIQVDHEAGWLAIWEVSPDGKTRSSISIFHPDQGLVRPDLARRIWDLCCAPIQITGHATPTAEVWNTITQDGVDHAYQAVAMLVGQAGISLPDARLRLLVRVER